MGEESESLRLRVRPQGNTRVHRRSLQDVHVLRSERRQDQTLAALENPHLSPFEVVVEAPARRFLTNDFSADVVVNLLLAAYRPRTGSIPVGLLGTPDEGQRRRHGEFPIEPDGVITLAV